MTTHAFTELVGVYHADGGLLGEARYLVGKVRGTAHCGLCDVTHGRVRRRPEWDRMVADLGVPVTLLHLNEMPVDVAAAVAEAGSPAVFGRRPDGTLQTLLTAPALDAAQGSVPRFAAAITEVIGR